MPASHVAEEMKGENNTVCCFVLVGAVIGNLYRIISEQGVYYIVKYCFINPVILNIFYRYLLHDLRQTRKRAHVAEREKFIEKIVERILEALIRQGCCKPECNTESMKLVLFKPDGRQFISGIFVTIPLFFTGIKERHTKPFP